LFWGGLGLNYCYFDGMNLFGSSAFESPKGLFLKIFWSFHVASELLVLLFLFLKKLVSVWVPSVLQQLDLLNQGFEIGLTPS